MSVFKSIFKVFVALTLISVAGFELKANSWDWTGPYRRANKDIHTLVITGDTGAPKIIADLIMAEIKQPYIQLPGNSSDKIAFFAAHQKKGIEIKRSDFTRFIDFVNPDRVLILGDESIVAKEYRDMISKAQTVVIIYADNWQNVANNLGKMFNMTYLPKDFAEFYDKIYGNKPYRPTTAKKKPVEIKSQQPGVRDEIKMQNEDDVKETTDSKAKDYVL